MRKWQTVLFLTGILMISQAGMTSAEVLTDGEVVEEAYGEEGLLENEIAEFEYSENQEGITGMSEELNEDVIYEYLKNIYSTILLKDIVTRQGIRNVPFLENLVLYLSDNIGNLFSVKNISDYLKSQKISISIPTIMDYLDGLTKAFLIYKVPRIDLNGLKVFEISEKYYFEDLGVRNALTGGYRPNDIAKVLENIVYKDLITRGYKVNVGYSKGYEVDFVATKKNEKVYIQVTYLLSSEKTIQREFSNLANIKDNYPKYVVSMDKFPVTSDYPGIIQIFMLDFLMKEKLSN